MPLDIFITFAIFFTGIFASYFGSFVSGGTGSLSVGLMILLGIPPQVTKATYQLGLLGWSISGIKNFLHSGHIPRRYILGSVIATFLGAGIGANLMTLTPNNTLQKITGGVFLIFLFMAWLRSRRKNTAVEKQISITKLRASLAYIGQFILSILSGYIPGAAGPLYFILYTELTGINIIQYKALGRITGIAFVLGTFYPILHAGLIHLEYVIPFSLGMYIGGHLGSKHLIKMGNTLALYIVYGSIFLLALYLLFS